MRGQQLRLHPLSRPALSVLVTPPRLVFLVWLLPISLSMRCNLSPWTLPIGNMVSWERRDMLHTIHIVHQALTVVCGFDSSACHWSWHDMRDNRRSTPSIRFVGRSLDRGRRLGRQLLWRQDPYWTWPHEGRLLLAVEPAPSRRVCSVNVSAACAVWK